MPGKLDKASFEAAYGTLLSNFGIAVCFQFGVCLFLLSATDEVFDFRAFG